jgi:hypothetical protein
MHSMSASTCAAIPMFAELSAVAKQSLAGRTIRLLVAVRVDGLAVDRQVQVLRWPRLRLLGTRELYRLPVTVILFRFTLM